MYRLILSCKRSDQNRIGMAGLVLLCCNKQCFVFWFSLFGLIYYFAFPDLSVFWWLVATAFSPILLFIITVLLCSCNCCDSTSAHENYNVGVNSPSAARSNNIGVRQPTTRDVFTIETDNNRTSQSSRDNRNINSLRVGSSLMESRNTANDSSSTNSLAQILQRSLEEGEIESRENTSHSPICLFNTTLISHFFPFVLAPFNDEVQAGSTSGSNLVDDQDFIKGATFFELVRNIKSS